MKTAELTGTALDWAVAQLEKDADIFYDVDYDSMGFLDHDDVFICYSPSSNWAQGGPIIERENITIQTDPTDPHPEQWSAYLRANLFTDDGSDCFIDGKTPLEAAMRCYVASKLGDEVEIPQEIGLK